MKTIDGRMVSAEADTWDIVRRYDTLMFDPAHRAYFEGSDFTNFGYWNPATEHQSQACADLMEVLLEMIPHKTGTILDVACGKGATTKYLLKWYASEHVTGVNLSVKQVRAARRLAPGCTFLVMDAVHLGFEDCSFDNILCVEAAFHFVTREKFFKEAFRVLKPGGRLVLSDILMTRQAEERKPYRTPENYLSSVEAYQALGRRVGFDPIEIIDATEPCWQGCYWYAVRYIHERYLKREVDLEGLQDFLKLTYRRARDIRYYLLASLQKGDDA